MLLKPITGINTRHNITIKNIINKKFNFKILLKKYKLNDERHSSENIPFPETHQGVPEFSERSR